MGFLILLYTLIPSQPRVDFLVLILVRSSCFTLVNFAFLSLSLSLQKTREFQLALKEYQNSLRKKKKKKVLSSHKHVTDLPVFPAAYHLVTCVLCSKRAKWQYSNTLLVLQQSPVKFHVLIIKYVVFLRAALCLSDKKKKCAEVSLFYYKPETFSG